MEPLYPLYAKPDQGTEEFTPLHHLTSIFNLHSTPFHVEPGDEQSASQLNPSSEPRYLSAPNAVMAIDSVWK